MKRATCVPLVQQDLCANRSSTAAKLWGSGTFFLPPQPGMYYPVSIVMVVSVLCYACSCLSLQHPLSAPFYSFADPD